jgi:hypothetical protein
MYVTQYIFCIIFQGMIITRWRSTITTSLHVTTTIERTTYQGKEVDTQVEPSIDKLVVFQGANNKPSVISGAKIQVTSIQSNNEQALLRKIASAMEIVGSHLKIFQCH